MDKEVFTKAEIGEFVNDKFVAVKVQMDKTPIDNNNIKQWYNEAKIFRTVIPSMPLLLIYSLMPMEKRCTEQ